MRNPTGAPARRHRVVEGYAVDAFVAAAHVRPQLACRMLAAQPGLVHARSSWGEAAIEAASHLGNPGLAWRCIEAGASIDLFTACALGDVRLTMARFEDSRRDARGVHGLPLLHFAIVGGNKDLLETLLRNGAEINPRGAPVMPLHSAVAAGRGETVRRLLEAGADVGAVDSLGATALEWAIDLDGPDSEAAWTVGRFLAAPG